jgi:hypothetical protein
LSFLEGVTMRALILAALIISPAAVADNFVWMGKPGLAVEKFGSIERATEQMQLDVNFCNYDAQKAAASMTASRGYSAPGGDPALTNLGNAMLSNSAADNLYYSCMQSKGWYVSQ